MPRIDTTVDRDRWRYKCPNCHSTDWRIHNGTIGCRHCGGTMQTLLDAKTGEEIRREDIELLGPSADHKAAFGTPQG